MQREQEEEQSIGLNAIYGLNLNEYQYKEEEQCLIGLNALCEMLVKQSDELKEEGLAFTQHELLSQAIEINPYSQDALFEMAMYEECENYNYEKAIDIYLELLEMDQNNISVLFNLADLYEKICDYENMKKYFNISGEKGDYESYLRLAKFYKNNCDSENARINLLNAINYYDDNEDVDKLLRHLNCLELLTILQEHHSEGINENLKRVTTILESEESAIIYKNKVRLFSRFQNIIECGICLENKLNIDMLCGHEICCDCYKRVYLDCCPFCRIDFD
jgi:tetratricopeptide (TPR) repeat protein